MDDKTLLSKLSNPLMRKIIDQLPYLTVRYDGYTLAVEKLYSLLFSLSQPFYYKEGCFWDGNTSIDLDYIVERYDLHCGYSIFHIMVYRMGSCLGCTSYSGYIPKTDLDLLKKQTETLGASAVIGQVFDNLIPDSILTNESFSRYAMTLMSDRSSIYSANYMLLTSKKMDLSKDLVDAMSSLFGSDTTMFHFMKDKHYFIYFFHEDSYNPENECIDFNMIDPCVYLKWLIAHGN